MAKNDGFVIKNKKLVSYTGSDEVINIPEGVEWVGESAFQRHRIKIVNCPESLVGIDDGAFEGCECLEEINFSVNIGVIGVHAFRNCISLVSVQIPPKVKEISPGAFRNCQNLREVFLPEGLESIEYGAFEYCESLEKLLIPDSVKKIEQRAFIGCTALKELSFPSTIKKVDFLSAFEYEFYSDSPIESVERRGTFEVEHQIPRVYLLLKPQLNPREVAYIFFYQHKKEWKIRASKYVTEDNANIVLDTFLEIMQAKDEITINNKNHVELFMSQYQKWLNADKCAEVTALLAKIKVRRYTKIGNASHH